MQDTLRLLKTVFRDALRLGIAPALLAGCADTGIEHDEGFVPVTCAGSEPLFLSGLEPAASHDYLALGLTGADMVYRIREELGTPCLNASAEDACLAALAAPGDNPALALQTFVDHQTSADLRATRGDEITIISSMEELLPFLAPIDTAADAVLLASAAGYSAECTRSGAKPVGDGFEVQLFRYFGCGGRRRNLLYVDASGNVSRLSTEVEHDAEDACIVGRRPAGLVIAKRKRRESLGDYFARAAELEAASVHAFMALRAELAAHGAPASLGRRAHSAAADEVRHARAVARLARAYGGRPRAPRVSPQTGVRDLTSIALENSVEGCVRETYGALVALHQAERARDPGIRQLYAHIAADETRHAALSWDVNDFAERRLGRASRRRVAEARRRAIADLKASGDELPTALAEHAGLPSPKGSGSLLDHLERTLWREPDRV